MRLRELDTSEERWKRKYGLVLVIWSCAVSDNFKTKNVTSFLNIFLMKLGNLKHKEKSHKIYRSMRIVKIQELSVELSSLMQVTIRKKVKVLILILRVTLMSKISLISTSTKRRKYRKSISIIFDLYLIHESHNYRLNNNYCVI